MHAAVMAYLQKERAVAEPIAAFHAFAAADAQAFIDDVLVIGVLHIGALDGAHRTLLIFRGGGQAVRLGRLGLEETEHNSQ